MPTYEFKCKCEYVFDKLIPMSKRNEIQICPECGQEATRTEIANRVGKLHIWAKP